MKCQGYKRRCVESNEESGLISSSDVPTVIWNWLQEIFRDYTDYLFLIILFFILLSQTEKVVKPIRSLRLWIARRSADKKLTKDTRKILDEVILSVGGTSTEQKVSMISNVEEIPLKLQMGKNSYTICPQIQDKLSIDYVLSWNDLQTKVLLKAIQKHVYPISELLPRSQVRALELYLAHKAALLQGFRGVAQQIREELVNISAIEGHSEVPKWYASFEKLCTQGNCLEGIIFPILQDVYERYVPDFEVDLRAECVEFVEWIIKWASFPSRIDIPPFLGKRIRCGIVPIFARKWSFYSRLGEQTASNCNHIFFVSSHRHEMKAIEAAIGTKISKGALKSEFGIVRLVLSETKDQNGQRIGYLSVELCADAASEEKKRSESLVGRRDSFVMSDNLLRVRQGNEDRIAQMAITKIRNGRTVLIENSDKESWSRMVDIMLRIKRESKAQIQDWAFITKAPPPIAMIVLAPSSPQAA